VFFIRKGWHSIYKRMYASHTKHVGGPHVENPCTRSLFSLAGHRSYESKKQKVWMNVDCIGICFIVPSLHIGMTMSVCLSIHMIQLENCCTDVGEIWCGYSYSYTYVFIVCYLYTLYAVFSFPSFTHNSLLIDFFYWQHVSATTGPSSGCTSTVALFY
jgi:hypothetical protein